MASASVTKQARVRQSLELAQRTKSSTLASQAWEFYNRVISPVRTRAAVTPLGTTCERFGLLDGGRLTPACVAESGSVGRRLRCCWRAIGDRSSRSGLDRAPGLRVGVVDEVALGLCVSLAVSPEACCERSLQCDVVGRELPDELGACPENAGTSSGPRARPLGASDACDKAVG